MNRFILIIVLISHALIINAQNPYQIGNGYWPVGDTSSITFCNGPTIGSSSYYLSPQEGYAVVSDFNCNLILACNGETVYNANEEAMYNSTFASPGGQLEGDISSTQGAVIVPKPNDPLSYYVFCADANMGIGGYTYSRIDMSLNGGLGDVDLSEKNIPLHTPGTEKIHATMHANGYDIWVMTHKAQSDQFVAYLVTSTGVQVSTPVISAVGVSHTTPSGNMRGYMKFSQSGAKLAIALESNAIVQLFNFDNATGIVSNAITLTDINMSACYGLEFSANEQFLYNSERWGTAIHQWDISSGIESIISASRINVSTGTVSTNGALQLAPDGKIYCARANHSSMTCISQPDLPGVACGFTDNVLDLGFLVNYREGLPNHANVFINSGLSFLVTDETCPGVGDGEIASNMGMLTYDSLVWSNGTTGLNLTNLAAGTYYVSVYDAGLVSSTDTVIVAAGIGVDVSVIINHPTTITPGSGSIELTPILGVSPFAYLWSTGYTGSTLSNLSQGTYSYTVSDAQGCELIDSATLITQNTLPWNYSITANNHTILLPLSPQINMAGAAISVGDFIGVFYDSLGTLKCGGYAEWNGGASVISAWGADAGYDGFAANEEFKWKFWRSSDQTEITAFALFDQMFANQEFFIPNGMSKVDSLFTLSIGGSVSTPTKAALSTGIMLAYQVNGSDYTAVSSAPILDGSYTIQGIEPGNFICYAIPDPTSPQALPNYYTGEDNWQNATILEVLEPANNIDLTLPDFVAYATGMAAIRGTVILGTDNNYNPAIYDSLWFEIPTKDAGDPARNIAMLLYDANMNLLDFDLSTEEGQFRFEFLEYGTYFIRPEKAGSTTNLLQIILSETNQSVENLVFTLNDGEITNIESNAINSTIKIYPNPVKDILNIETTAACEIRLYSLTGQSIKNTTASSSGKHQTQLNLSDVTPGVYILEISNNSEKSHTKIIKN